MGVILTQHLTYHAGTFLIGFVARVTDSGHTIEDTAVHGFESVSHIRKGTGNNYRHRIVDIGGFHFLLDVDFDNSVIIDGLSTIKCLILVHFFL